jgi:flagellar biosynthesis protein FliP
MTGIGTRLSRALGGVLIALAATCAHAQADERAPESAASAVATAQAASAPAVAAHAAAASAARTDPAGTPHAGTKAGGSAQGSALNIALPNPGTDGQTALALRVVMSLTLLAVLPSLLICTTAFLRIIVVLSMLRQAIGMPETPPNPVLIGLALFLTLFTMQPVFQTMSHDSIEPFMQGRIDATAAYQGAAKPLREFMIRQTREHDLALMVELSKAPQPRTIEDVGMVQLVPAFIVSELRAAFQIGFVIFLPFLLIDLIVSSILMALGMMMMPPVTVSLPLKILMFVLVDGWSLILKSLVGSFH